MTDKEKLVYEILCSDEIPPEDQHWEGFVASKIVAALAESNKFNPDWDAMAVMVEEQQRMAKRIDELEAALAQGEQEPVAFFYVDADGEERFAHPEGYYPNYAKPLYSAPPQREWQGLTNEEIEMRFIQNECCDDLVVFEHVARAIEAKLKEKNT